MDLTADAAGAALLSPVYCRPLGAADGQAWIDPAASGINNPRPLGSGPTLQFDARDSELACVQSPSRGTGRYLFTCKREVRSY